MRNAAEQTISAKSSLSNLLSVTQISRLSAGYLRDCTVGQRVLI
jgi:hypothetical protein